MKITSIQKKQGSRWLIEVDDAYFAILDAEIIVSHHLKAGMETDEETLQKVLKDAERRTVRERALYLLDYRDYPRQELILKLSQKADREIAEEVVYKLQEMGLINDEAYAAKLARHLILTKKHGSRRALMELLQKGIDRQTAAQAVDSVEPEEDLLTELVRRKYARFLGDPEDQKSREKVIRALMRLGHGYYDALGAIEQVEQEMNEEEDDG